MSHRRAVVRLGQPFAIDPGKVTLELVLPTAPDSSGRATIARAYVEMMNR